MIKPRLTVACLRRGDGARGRGRDEAARRWRVALCGDEVTVRAAVLAPGSMPAVSRISCRHKKAVTGKRGAQIGDGLLLFDQCPRDGIVNPKGGRP